MAAYYRGDAVELPDGTVTARCRHAHIQAVIDGELDVDWPAVIARIGAPPRSSGQPSGSVHPARR